MFEPVLPLSANKVTVFINGSEFSVPEGISVSAALLQSGITVARTTAKKNAERAPFCMMGVCFECLMEIDGVPNQQACLTLVREGMNIVQQKGAVSFSPDIPSAGRNLTPVHSQIGQDHVLTTDTPEGAS